MNGILELSIVLPTYNERENIIILIPQIEEVFKSVKHEIIVVDDNSPDNTAECVLELNKIYGNIRLLSRPKREGIGAAIREGYNYAKGKVVLSSDSDLSFPVEDMLKLFNRINEGYDLVVGCRHSLKGSYYEMGKINTKIKGTMSKLGNLFLKNLTRMDIGDFSANFRAIKKEAWDKIDIKEKDNMALFEMIIKANYQGMKITKIPVSFFDRIYGKSKLHLFIKIPKYVFKMMYYIKKYKKRKEK